MLSDGRAAASWPCLVCGCLWSEHTLDEWHLGCKRPRQENAAAANLRLKKVTVNDPAKKRTPTRRKRK